ncbi:hypothetical protein BV911_09905 [Pseudoruegeria sp. SK021]|nr:hypothetical protein BV911_09905 [Pseudoruegeria sp. SK021]
MGGAGGAAAVIGLINDMCSPAFGAPTQEPSTKGLAIVLIRAAKMTLAGADGTTFGPGAVRSGRVAPDGTGLGCDRRNFL